MLDTGPLLESLTRRLAETPADFLAEPRVGKTGQVHVAAVVNDLILDLGGTPLTPAEARAFETRDAARHRNRLSLTLVGAWLLHDPWFQERRPARDTIYEFLAAGLAETARYARARDFVNDPERREELARLCLKALGLRPAGETEAQALDRLQTLSTVERQRVIAAAQEAERRAQAVREEMARKAAEESADKWSRE